MATPRAVARNLRRNATRLEKVTAEVVAEVATLTVEAASSIGGTFRFAGSRPYRMYASVTEVRNRKGSSSAKVTGVPVGAWVMKSYGRRGGYDVVSRDGGPLDIRAAGGEAVASVRVGSGTSGDGRWDRVVAQVTDAYADLGEQLAIEAVEG